jgi:beta-glucanase (GH16 family)
VRRRNYVIGLLVVAGIVVWDVGLPGSKPVSHGISAASASASAQAAAAAATVQVNPTPPSAPALPGVVGVSKSPEWSATFTGAHLDKAVWSTCYPQYQQAGCQNFSNSKIEGEWYLPSQDQVSGGELHLVAQHEPTAGTTLGGAPKTYECRSGMVTSYPGFSFEYGYIQIEASIPTGKGLWPALWLAATNLQWPPEMDILEAWGANHHYPAFYASTYFHFSGPSGPTSIHGSITPASAAVGWHTFALSWTKTQLTWLVDGRAVLTTHKDIPHQKMYFIADLAESISPAAPTVRAGECDGSLLIKSVKVWKP